MRYLILKMYLILRNLVQEWTILDVHFGVPLFDIDCNTRICENLVKNLCDDRMYVFF